MGVPEDVEAIVDDATAAVLGRFAATEDYADDAYSKLVTALQDTASQLQTLQPSSVDITISSPGGRPSFSELENKIPDIDAIVGEIETIISNIKSLAAPEKPSLSTPSAILYKDPGQAPDDIPSYRQPDEPSEFTATAPDFEPLSPPEKPARPSPSVPDEPELLAIGDLERPSITVPAFLESLDLSELAFYYPEINFEEIDHGDLSISFSTIQSRLLTLIAGGTGMPLTVQDAYYNQSIEREEQAIADAKSELVSTWSLKGFDLPDDEIIDRLDRADIEFGMKRIDRSREILWKAWELEQKNISESVAQAVMFETQLMGLTNSRNQRAFESEKAVAALKISVMDMELKRYGMRLEKFKAKLVEWEGHLKAELAKGDVYIKEVDLEKARGELNVSKVSVYREQMQANGITWDVFMKDIAAWIEELRADKESKLDKFKALVEVFGARINLKNAEYNLYQAKQKGEETKVAIFTAKVNAYRAKVEAAQADLQGQLGQLQGTTSYNESLTKNYLGEIEGYKALTGAEIAKAEVGIKGIDAEANIFTAIAKAYETLGDLNVKEWEANIKHALGKAELRLKADEIEIANYEKIKTVYIEALKGIAQTIAHVCVGALSAVSAQAQISADGRASESYSHTSRVDVA